MDETTIKQCEEAIGYHFTNRPLLIQALTHSSTNGGDSLDNERMEFLGDSIVGLVICEHLYHAYPDYAEGRLTRMKSAIVSRSALGRVAKSLGLDEYLIVGAGMAKRRHLPVSLYANVFEAVIAAIFLDSGMEDAKRVILEHLKSEIGASEAEKRYKNYKSILQHYAQRELQVTPTYRVLREEGPDHVKFFEVIAVIGDKEHKAGWGRSKKEAEQRAAEETLKDLGVNPEE
jgi:ribonuclease III